MLIKTKIIILFTFSLALTAIVGFILIQTNLALRKEIEKQDLVTDLRSKLFDLAVLRDEYLLYHAERSIIQLQLEPDAIEKILLSLSNLSLTSEERALVSRLEDNNNFTRETLSKIVASSKNQAGNTLSIIFEVEQRLVNQLLINSQESFTGAIQLATTSRNIVQESQNRATIFISIFFTTSIIVILTTVLLIWLSIIKPLIKLKEFALRVADLDFSSTIDIAASKDEIGELVGVFNQMILKLKESHMSLDSSNQQLRASNEQLRANTEQLRAVNQQLVAGEKILKDKIDELEAFNKLTVGRELKMVELKKEIEMLRKRATQSP
ncbi:MAG TPA: HAMP domain-containing protein [Candidatus Paceibacterota bacterium]|nr:HAMP domain-containing protein [Candidatus Paceibacterota bacterium]